MNDTTSPRQCPRLSPANNTEIPSHQLDLSWSRQWHIPPSEQTARFASFSPKPTSDFSLPPVAPSKAAIAGIVIVIARPVVAGVAIAVIMIAFVEVSQGAMVGAMLGAALKTSFLSTLMSR